MTAALRRLMRALDETRTGGATAVLMRHAARGPLPPNDPGAAVPISRQGAQDARRIGSRLGHHLATVRTSPVLRCRQTADALSAGARGSSAPIPDELLGAAGVFVTDADLAWRNWLDLGHVGVTMALIEGHELPGMAPPRAAARRLVAHILDVASSAPGVHVFVTHDSLLAPTIAHAFETELPPGEWPGFLESLVLARHGVRVEAWWRDRTREVSWT